MRSESFMQAEAASLTLAALTVSVGEVAQATAFTYRSQASKATYRELNVCVLVKDQRTRYGTEDARVAVKKGSTIQRLAVATVLVSTAGGGSPIAARIVVCRHCYASLSICRLYPCSWRPGRKEPIATQLIWTAERSVKTALLKRLPKAAARKIAKEAK